MCQNTRKKIYLFIKCSTGFFLNKLGLIHMASSNSHVLQRSHRPQVKDPIWSRDLVVANKSVGKYGI